MASKSSHVRSNSFPSRSHPTTVRVEEVLNKINSSELPSGSSESICYSLCRLAELYQSTDDLLKLPSTIQALSTQQKGGEAFLDGSMTILDVCSIAREIVSQFKDNVRDLQSSLRRRKGESSMELILNNYNCFRKKMKKDAKRLIAANLKHIDQSLDDETAPICSLIKEVNSTTIAVFQSVLVFLAASKTKSSKWSLVSRSVKQNQESENELENVDSALRSLCKNDQRESEKIQSIQTRLASLEASIDGIENGLEGLFRCLIKSRTSLLNIFSC